MTSEFVYEIYQPVDLENLQAAIFFACGNFGWTSEDLDEQDNIYGSLPYALVVAKSDSVIVGTVALFQRKVQFAQKPVKLGGVGMVCTHRKHRGEGIGKRLMEIAMQKLQTDGLEIAILCTDLEQTAGYYKPFGFQILPQGYHYTTKRGVKCHENSAMIASLNNPILVTEILNSTEVLNYQGTNW